jgi:hypothetical protein
MEGKGTGTILAWVDECTKPGTSNTGRRKKEKKKGSE